MKKVKLKLSLSKSKISNLQATEVKGGSSHCTVSIWWCDTEFGCVSDHGECTDAPTMTCADWSCKCIQDLG